MGRIIRANDHRGDVPVLEWDVLTDDVTAAAERIIREAATYAPVAVSQVAGDRRHLAQTATFDPAAGEEWILFPHPVGG